MWDEGQPPREMAAVWRDASRARSEGPGAVKGVGARHPERIRPSVFWGCQPGDAGGQGRDPNVKKTSLVFLSYRCPEARGQHRPCWVRKGWQAPSSHGFQGGLQVPRGGEERSAKSESR